MIRILIAALIGTAVGLMARLLGFSVAVAIPFAAVVGGAVLGFLQSATARVEVG